MERAFIYGDSLLKATVPDENMHYRFHLPEVMAQYPTDRLEVVNRAKMGATVTKGLSLVEHDVQRGMDARWALVAYGGNDSDFDWDAIQERPEEEHIPRTALPEFRSTLLSMLQKLRDQSVQPVLMTLPPIDAQRYLDFLCRAGRSKERIMAWLGDIQHIYRHQELYSDTVAQVAYETGTPIIRVRESFLREKHLPGLISPDGIHLTMEGYTKMFDTLAGWLRQAIA